MIIMTSQCPAGGGGELPYVLIDDALFLGCLVGQKINCRLSFLVRSPVDIKFGVSF